MPDWAVDLIFFGAALVAVPVLVWLVVARKYKRRNRPVKMADPRKIKRDPPWLPPF